MVPYMNADETARVAAGRLLAWYEAMGVDAVVDDMPVDWLARGDVAPGATLVRALAEPAGPAPGRPVAPPPGYPQRLTARMILAL